MNIFKKEKYNMNKYYELRDDLADKELYSAGILDDVFSGYLTPHETLKNENDIKEVENAITIVQKYVDTLNNSDMIGEM
jgi:hypothetical protein